MFHSTLNPRPLHMPKMSSQSAPAPTTEEKGPINLLRPLLLMYYSLSYLPITIFHLLLSFQFSTFLSIDEFKDVWFARFWAFFGPMARDVSAPAVMPLLQKNARGVCLDIGPGSGQWLYLFQRANNPEITKIYGIEPNPGMHKALRENAVKAGLSMCHRHRFLAVSQNSLQCFRRQVRNHRLRSGGAADERRFRQGEHRHHYHRSVSVQYSHT